MILSIYPNDRRYRKDVSVESTVPALSSFLTLSQKLVESLNWLWILFANCG